VEVLTAGEVLIHRRGLPGQADHLAHGGRLADHVEPGDPSRPAVGAEQGGQDPHGGGLASAVGAEQSEHAAWWDGQVHALNGLDVPERLAEAVGQDRWLVVHASSLTSRVAIASDASYQITG